MNLISVIMGVIALAFPLSVAAQEGTVRIDQDSRIKTLLETKNEMVRENSFATGFTIQLYYGERRKATDVLSRYRGVFPDWPATIVYEAPNYKVWAGDFLTRLEADRALLHIQKRFESAFVLKPERRE